DNPNYRNSYEAEKNLRDAFLSCNEMEEFRTKIGNLNHKCANALTKDKYLMEQAFYNDLKEIVRVHASNRILEKVDTFDNVMDLITMVNEEENKCMIEITMDEANRQFHYDWGLIDNVEIYESAVVPDEYKQDMMEAANSNKESIKENVARLEENNSHWQENWKLTPDIITEHHHRRLLPYKDEHVAEQLKKYKSITNR
ncbi:MAG: hypothetical protein ABSG15_12370, partial [FCB group bacterium]